jgi:hypothetical protein
MDSETFRKGNCNAKPAMGLRSSGFRQSASVEKIVDDAALSDDFNDVPGYAPGQ